MGLTMRNFQSTFFWITLWLCVFSEAKLTCKDYKDNVIEHGQYYKPDASDMCKECLCDKGFATMCSSVSCSPPSCPNWEQVKTECCKFNCIDTPLLPTDTPTDSNTTNNIVTSSDSLTTLGLRLVASTVTSFLVLALLLFAVHQLRRKRLILAMRRYSESRRTENYQHDIFSPDYFGMECPPYEEPPPPYSPPKPLSEHPDEAPPPYDSVDANHNVSSRVHPEQSVLRLVISRREDRRNDSAVSNVNSSPAHSNNSEMSSDSSALRNNNQISSLPRQSSQSSCSTFLENFTLPPWNSFNRHRINNSHHSTFSNVRHLQRGISENSDFGSDRASTDFGISSDAETHFNQCDPEENSVLRDFRLSNLLSRPAEPGHASTTGCSASQPSVDLQNDAHYPESTFSNLSHCSDDNKVSTITSNNGSPLHHILSTPRHTGTSPAKSKSESSTSDRNTNSSVQAVNVNKTMFNEQNCSVV